MSTAIERDDSYDEHHGQMCKATYKMTVTITLATVTDGTEGDEDREREHHDDKIEAALKAIEALGYGVDIYSEIEY